MRGTRGRMVLLAGAVLAAPLSAQVRDLRSQPADWTLLSGSSGLYEVAAGEIRVVTDADGDGAPELIADGLWRAGRFRAGGLDVRTSTPDLSFQGGPGHIVASDDMNGDGIADLVVGDNSDGEFHVFFGPTPLPGVLTDPPDPPPAGAFTWKPPQEYREAFGDLSIVSLDFNGDGARDLAAVALCCSSKALISAVFGIAGPLTPGGTVNLDREPPAFSRTFSKLILVGLAGGDLDGDGADDLVVLEDDRRVVRVFLGPNLSGEVTVPDQEVRYDAGSTLEISDVAVGDVNGDGLDDLLLGVRGADGPRGPCACPDSTPDTPIGAGQVHVVFGRALPAPSVDLSAGEADLVLDAAACCDALGSSVGAGDWTGDGVDDLLLGAPGSDGPSGSRQDAGAVYVLAGKTGLGGEVDLAGVPADLVVHGPDAGDRLAEEPTFIRAARPLLVADVNGDGVPDLAARGYGEGAGNARALRQAEIHVVFGTPSGPFDLLRSLGNPSSLTLERAGVESPITGDPGWAADGALHYYRIREPAGTRATLAVTRVPAGKTVRISWEDGRPGGTLPDPVETLATVDHSCVKADGISTASIVIGPRDASGALLGAALDVRPTGLASWGPGVPSGGFRDLGNGLYRVEVAAAAAGAAAPRAIVEGVSVDLPPLTFTDAGLDLDIDVSPFRAHSGQPVRLVAVIGGGTPRTLRWRLGDGTTASGMEVIHTYDRAGYYAVVLDATDDRTCLTRATVGLSVLP